MLSFGASAVAAGVPALLLVWYFYSLLPPPRSRGAIAATFALGVVSVLPVIAVQVPLLAHLGALSWPYDRVFGTHLTPYLRGAALAFLAVAPTEEFSHFVILLLYCAASGRLQTPRDGLVYGAIVALGFAAIENVGYAYTLGVKSAMARGFSAVLCHAFFGALMGYYLGMARTRPRRRLRYLVRSLSAPILLHGLYDFPLLTILSRYEIGVVGELAEADLAQVALALVLMPGVLIVMWLWVARLIRRTRPEPEATELVFVGLERAEPEPQGQEPAAPSAVG